MEIQQLIYLKEIARLESFSRAAETLHVTKDHRCGLPEGTPSPCRGPGILPDNCPVLRLHSMSLAPVYYIVNFIKIHVFYDCFFSFFR